jgi:hypothetical protein
MTDRAFRRIALKLHALHALDRAWVLRLLPDEAQRRISLLLRELKALGIRSIPEAVENLGFTTSSIQFDTELVREIDSIDSETVLALFDDLPLRQKALVFHAYQWRWASTFWNRLADDERRRLANAMKSMVQVRPLVIASILGSFRALARERQANRISAVRG